MMHPHFSLSELILEEQIELSDSLLIRLEDGPDSYPLTDARAREIDRRLEAYRRAGDPGHPWPAVLDRIEKPLTERGG